MKRSITVVAVIRPVPQPRQRHSKNRSYIPDSHPIHTYKAVIRSAGCRTMKGREPIAAGVPITVSYKFLLPAPDNTPKRRGRVPHIKENADSDNLQKAVQDALTGIVWAKDGAIWKWSGEKIEGARGEDGLIEIVVSW